MFEAWRHAQSHIHSTWTRLTDIANLQPEIPLALREAAELVINSGGDAPDQEDLLRKLNARWDNRIVAAVRAIVRSDDPPKVRLQRLAEYVKTEGLPTPEAPKPLPPVALDDIRVVCWMAVTPKTALTG